MGDPKGEQDPAAPTMTRDPQGHPPPPELTMEPGTGRAPRGPMQDREAESPPALDLFLLFLNNQLRYKVQNLPPPLTAPSKGGGAGGQPRNSSKIPIQGL